MRINIDVKKSIETRKLVSTSLYHKFIDNFNSILVAIVFIVIIIGPTVGIKTEITTLKILLTIIVLTLTAIEITISKKMEKLTLTDNKKVKVDRDIFNLLAEENSWSIVKEDEQLIIIQTNNWLSQERQISIILDNGFIYVNVMSFGMYDIKTPLYFKKDKQILNQIMNKITLHNNKL